MAALTGTFSTQAWPIPAYAGRQVRKSFDGLSGMVRQYMKSDPLSGDVYIFVNHRRNQIRLLVWDRSGFAFYAKRLEQGTFELGTSHSENPTTGSSKKSAIR